MSNLKPPDVSRSVSCESGASDYMDAVECFQDDDNEIFDEDYMYEAHILPQDESHDAFMHPLLYKDMENLIFIYGENSLQYRLFESIDEIDVELHIPLGFLDETTAEAWNVNKNEPLIVRLHCSLSTYLESSNPPKVEVLQLTKKERFGFGCQVRKFLETFISQEWEHVYRDYQKFLEEDKKVNKNRNASVTKIDSVQTDRISEIVSDEAVAKLVELGIEADLARNALVITHGNVEDATNLVMNKPELCIEDQTLEASKPPKPSRSTSQHSENGASFGNDSSNANDLYLGHLFGTGDTNDTDDKPETKKDKKTLKRQLSHPPILNRLKKMLPSLTRTISMLPGKPREIDAPRIIEDLNLMPLSTLEGQNAKTLLPTIFDGFLVQIFRYVRQRIPTMNEYCVVCDEPHVFQNGAMLKPAVCSRELCVFAFQTLGVMADAAEDIATGAEVVDLLINMTRAASNSTRHTIIFDPFPTIVDPKNPCNLLFTATTPNFKAIREVIAQIPLMDEIASITSSLKQKLDERNPAVYPLIQWIITSNRSHIVKLPLEKQLEFMHTPHQFLLLSSPPAKELAFQEAKKKHGSTFAFHGSSIENWHSIIRQGLLSASGTKLQVNGAAYGKGIYLSPSIATSMGYSRMGYGNHNVKKKPEQKTTVPRFLKSENITCIALCEVITSKDLRKNNAIWVCPDPDHVCTRFFFVYENGQVGDSSIDTQDSKYIGQIKRACGYKC